MTLYRYNVAEKSVNLFYYSIYCNLKDSENQEDGPV